MTTHTDDYTVKLVCHVDTEAHTPEKVAEVVASIREGIIDADAEVRRNRTAFFNETVKPLLKEISGYKKDFDLVVRFDSHVRENSGRIEHVLSPVVVSISYADALPADHDVWNYAEEVARRMMLEAALNAALSKISGN